MQIIGVECGASVRIYWLWPSTSCRHKQWLKSIDKLPNSAHRSRGSFLAHLSDCMLHSHWKVKSKFIVHVCTL